MRARLFTLISSCAAVAAFPSCASPPSGGPESNATAPVAAPLTHAQQFVQLNAHLDTTLHLLAREFVNNNTEVVSLYEPTPGHILAVGAGHPNGASQLQGSSSLLAMMHGAEPGPGQAMPQALIDAIARQQAGVGLEQFQSNPVDAPDSVASFGAAATTAAAPTTKAATPTPSGPDGVQSTQSAIVGTGYCDTQWQQDFPSNLVGTKTDQCTVFNPVKPIAASWAAEFGSLVAPKGNTCVCSCRTTQSLRNFHAANSDGSFSNNNWENFVNVCPVQRAATMTVTASNGSGTFNVPEDTFTWVEDTGTVSCFLTTCTATHDIGSFNVSITSQTTPGDGLINYLAEAYGP